MYEGFAREEGLRRCLRSGAPAQLSANRDPSGSLFFYCHLVTHSGLIIKEPSSPTYRYEPRKNSGIRLGKRTEGGAGCAGFRGAAYAIRMALGSFIIAEFYSAN